MSKFLFVVPERWRTETRGDESIITSPSGLSVTIDWARREIRPGISSYGKPINQTTYARRNWQQRMVDDALAYLSEHEATLPGKPTTKPTKKR